MRASYNPSSSVPPERWDAFSMAAVAGQVLIPDPAVADPVLVVDQVVADPVLVVDRVAAAPVLAVDQAWA